MSARNVWERLEVQRAVERYRPVIAAASALGFIVGLGVIGVAEVMGRAWRVAG